MKTILSLDLGTHCGWAYRESDGIITAGVHLLQTDAETTAAGKLRRDRTLDARIPNLYSLLKRVWIMAPQKKTVNSPIDFLVFEDVQFSKFTLQTQLWGSLRAAVWLFCHDYGIPRDCCPTGTLKLFAAGRGNASKPEMVQAATRLYPTVEFDESEDAADALCLMAWAEHLLKRAAKPERPKVDIRKLF